ncbi:hypothetical protein NXY56_006837 [Leishmania guyanensis]
MRRLRSVASLQLVPCSHLQCGKLPCCRAPQLHSLSTSNRCVYIRATCVFYAPPSQPRPTSMSSTSPLSAKRGSAPPEKAAVEPPPLSLDTRAVSSTAVTPLPAGPVLLDTTSKKTMKTASASASEGPAQPEPPPSPLQESLIRRLLASWQQGVVASIGAVMGIGFLLYFLYTPVKEDTVHHTAVVASEALADARLKGQAVQLSKDVVLEVLRNPKSLDATVDVVVELLAREETKIAVSSLLQSLFEDHYTQEVTKKFVLQVVQDPWIQDQLQVITEEQVRKLLNSAAIKSELSRFLLKSALDSLEKPQLHYEAAKAMRHSVASLVNFWWS